MNRPLAWVLVFLLTAQFAWAESAEITGVTRWARRAELGTPVSGVVSEVRVSPGQRVSKGEVLVGLDDRGFRARVAEARANVVEAEQKRLEAKRELDRALELYDRTVLSEHDRQLAEIASASAEAVYQRALAKLTQSQLDLEYSAIRAPFDGFVVAVETHPGATVISDLQSLPLVTVAEAGRIVVQGRASAEQLHAFSQDARVDVRIQGRNYPGTIAAVGLDPLDGGSGEISYPVTVDLELPDGEVLRPGQAAVLTSRPGNPD